MDFSDLITMIDQQLEDERVVCDSRVLSAATATWRRGGHVAELAPSTATGVRLSLATNDRTMHPRTFAATRSMIPRIARSIVEHLTGYVAERSI